MKGLACECKCVCCIIKAEECWRGIGGAVGPWERPLCLLVQQGTETSHCESGQRWVTVLSIVFPPPFPSLAQPRTREGEESGFSSMGQLEHAHQELRLQGSQSAGFMILSDSPATSNLDESYRVTHYLHQPIRVHSLMTGLLLKCTLVRLQAKVLWVGENTHCRASGNQCRVHCRTLCS